MIATRNLSSKFGAAAALDGGWSEEGRGEGIQLKGMTESVEMACRCLSLSFSYISLYFKS